MTGERVFVVGLGLASFASAFGMRIVDPAVPRIAEHFGIMVQTATLLATAFSVAYAVGQPFIGPYGDAVGKVRVIRWCVAILVVGHAICAIAPSFETLLLLRGLTGIAGGGIIPVCLAVVGDRIPIERRQIVMGRFLTMLIIGQMAGATSAGLLADAISWRAGFAAASLVAIAASVAVAYSGLRDVDPPRPFRVSELPSRYRIVFSNPKAAILYAIMIIEGAVIFGLMPYVAAILAERFGIGSTEAGIVIGAVSIGGIVYGLAVPFFMRRLGAPGMLIGGGVIAGTMLIAFALSPSWILDAAIFSAVGFGFFMMHNTLQTYATEVAPAARGAAVSLFAGFFFVGHALGPIAIGFAKDQVGVMPVLIALGLIMATLGPAARVLLLSGDQRPR